MFLVSWPDNFYVSRRLSKIMDIETRASRHLASLGKAPLASSLAQRFAWGLHSVGVGLCGLVVDKDRLEAEDFLE